MMALGTQKRASDEIALDVDRLGARLACSSGWDASFIEIEGLSEDLPALLDILSDVVLNPTFPKGELGPLKERRIASLIQHQDESGFVADEQFMQLVFDGTPYGHPRRGTVESVRRISLDDLERFYNRHFVADQCVLMIVGDIQPEKALQLTAEFLASLAGGSDPRNASACFSVPKRPHRLVRIIDRPDLTQSQIRMGHPGIQRTSPDYYCFQVANYVLGGGGFSSRLMEKVRSQKGYTYGIYSNFKARRSPGPFTISTFTPNDHTFVVVTEVLEVLNGFIQKGVTEKELEEAKNFYLGSYPFRFDTQRKTARGILEVELYGLGIQSLYEYPQKISGVTRIDIQEVVRRHLFPEALSIVIVGNAQAFKKEMDAFGPVEVIEFQTLVAQS
jgi:zinc protease